jgi:hypothetical protein
MNRAPTYYELLDLLRDTQKPGAFGLGSDLDKRIRTALDSHDLYMRLKNKTLNQADAVRDIALSAVHLAAHVGLVVTVEQQPLKPLAMGNYKTVVNVRPARHSTTVPTPQADQA